MSRRCSPTSGPTENAALMQLQADTSGRRCSARSLAIYPRSASRSSPGSRAVTGTSTGSRLCRATTRPSTRNRAKRRARGGWLRGTRAWRARRGRFEPAATGARRNTFAGVGDTAHGGGGNMRFGAGIWLFGQFVDRYATDATVRPSARSRRSSAPERSGTSRSSTSTIRFPTRTSRSRRSRAP